ncbi:MAG TPA: hypothetical protein DCW42_09360 [Bacteroidetes bacterium]|nr:hypothetical protein [Bacteroidota bacterium]
MKIKMKMNNKVQKSLLIAFAIISLFFGRAYSQTSDILDKQAIIDSLTTIDPEIKKYFPRWKICEPDLQIQIYHSFAASNYSRDLLDQQSIEVLAAPREYDDEVFQILSITCGKASMNAVEIESQFGDILTGFLSGNYKYSGKERGTVQNIPKRDYCYTDIPIEIPLTQSQAAAIVNYLQPTNVNQAFTLSLFEQSIKIGETGFWLRSTIGNDEIGYPYWYAGENKIVLQRPLYVNKDTRTSRAIPYLINAYIGGAYRTSSGIDPGTMFSWIPKRTLNNAKDGKLVAGIDFNMPFKPELGVSLRAEVPMSDLKEDYTIELEKYGYIIPSQQVDNGRIDSVAPILRTSGILSLYYNWWLNPQNPENYIRFDVGMTYSDVREFALVKSLGEGGAYIYSLSKYKSGLKLYKPNEFGDWVYMKIDYRNQAAFPFGVSVQYSNQILLGDVWIPIFGNWLYIEAKYSTPLRPLRPYEIRNFFMISPILRLTI